MRDEVLFQGEGETKKWQMVNRKWGMGKVPQGCLWGSSASGDASHGEFLCRVAGIASIE